MRVTSTSGYKYKLPTSSKNKLAFSAGESPKPNNKGTGSFDLSFIMAGFKSGLGEPPSAPQQQIPASMTQASTPGEQLAIHSGNEPIAAELESGAVQILSGMRTGSNHQLETTADIPSDPPIPKWPAVNDPPQSLASTHPALRPVAANPFAIGRGRITHSPGLMDTTTTPGSSRNKDSIAPAKNDPAPKKSRKRKAIEDPVIDSTEGKKAPEKTSRRGNGATDTNAVKRPRKKTTDAAQPKRARKKAKTGPAAAASSVNSLVLNTGSADGLTQIPLSLIQRLLKLYQDGRLSGLDDPANPSRIVKFNRAFILDADGRTVKMVPKAFSKLSESERNKKYRELEQAAIKEDKGKSDELLKQYPELLNYGGKDGITQIKNAAYGNNVEMVKYYLQRPGIELNGVDGKGKVKAESSAIQWADIDEPGYLDTVELFVDHAEKHPGSIQFKLQDKKGNTIREYLFQHKKDYRLVDQQGRVQNLIQRIARLEE